MAAAVEYIRGMVVVVTIVFLSSATTGTYACDRCVHERKVAFAHVSPSAGACGYGSLASGLNSGYLAAASPTIYKDGAGCGACFLIRCKDDRLCNKQGVRVIVTTDQNQTKAATMTTMTDLVVTPLAFAAMAQRGMASDLLKQAIVNAQYKRVPCEHKGKNLSVQVVDEEEESKNKRKTKKNKERGDIDYLAIKLLYEGGQTEIVGVDVAQVDSSNWGFMTRNHGAIWDTNRVPTGPLQFRFVVTSGFDGKYYWAKKAVLPSFWQYGAIYDTGLQINDIAQESCSPCDNSTRWLPK